MQDEGQDQSQTPTNWQFKPGETITPGQSTASTQPEPQVPVGPAINTTATTVLAANTPTQETPLPISQPTTAEGVVSWTASEFISHSKSFGWYALLTLAAIAAAAVIYFVTKSFISAFSIVMAGGLLGAFAFMTRQPRTLQYQLDNTGVHIQEKLYTYGDFKSFAILSEGPISSLTLTPTKRFMPPITVYYDPNDEERIAGALSTHLPFEEKHDDAVDRFMKRIRF